MSTSSNQSDANRSQFARFVEIVRKPAVAYAISFCLGLCLLASLEWPDTEKPQHEITQISSPTKIVMND